MRSCDIYAISVTCIGTALPTRTTWLSTGTSLVRAYTGEPVTSGWLYHTILGETTATRDVESQYQ
jgi:hypothetical protein